MTESEEIREEIAQIEEWLRTGVINELEFNAKMTKLQAELADALAREPEPEPEATDVASEIVAEGPAADTKTVAAESTLKAEAAQDTTIASLERLQRLRTEGVLTGEEFEVQKRSVLGLPPKAPEAAETKVIKAATKPSTSQKAAANANTPPKPSEMVSAAVVAGLLLVGGGWLFSGLFGGAEATEEKKQVEVVAPSTDKSTVASVTKTKKVEVAAVEPKLIFSITSGTAYPGHCLLNVEFKNPSDQFMKYATLRVAAVDKAGNVLGQSTAITHNIRANGFALERMFFQNVQCDEIEKMRASSEPMEFESGPDSIFFVEG